jgi:hypothetical protein
MSPQSGQGMNRSLAKSLIESYSDNCEDAAGIQDLSGFCLARCSRAKFTTAAAGEGSERF